MPIGACGWTDANCFPLQMEQTKGQGEETGEMHVPDPECMKTLEPVFDTRYHHEEIWSLSDPAWNAEKDLFLNGISQASRWARPL
jgi:hypothetical protein